MARLTGIYTKLKGSMGQFTFKQLNGQTVVSEKVEKKSTPVRTWRQMVRRVAWANIINIYRAFTGKLHPSFENKSRLLSDYNEFMKANLDVVNVYLNKEEANAGGCVVPAYQVSRGSLPSISTTIDAETKIASTDIVLGATFNITAGTTVKQFSDQVIQANPDKFKNGDMITIFLAKQEVNAVTGIPFVTINAEQILLDQSDNTTLLRSLVSAAAVSVVDGNLGSGSAVNGAIAYVHSRVTSSGTKVSTQRFVVSNDTLADYVTDAACDEAVKSYGGVNKGDYLTPGNGDQELPDPGF